MMRQNPLGISEITVPEDLFRGPKLSHPISRVVAMELTPVETAMAELEAAAERFQQVLDQDLFRCPDGDLGPLIERSHRLEAKVKSGAGLVGGVRRPRCRPGDRGREDPGVAAAQIAGELRRRRHDRAHGGRVFGEGPVPGGRGRVGYGHKFHFYSLL